MVDPSSPPLPPPLTHLYLISLIYIPLSLPPPFPLSLIIISRSFSPSPLVTKVLYLSMADPSSPPSSFPLHGTGGGSPWTHPPEASMMAGERKDSADYWGQGQGDSGVGVDRAGGGASMPGWKYSSIHLSHPLTFTNTLSNPLIPPLILSHTHLTPGTILSLQVGVVLRRPSPTAVRAPCECLSLWQGTSLIFWARMPSQVRPYTLATHPYTRVTTHPYTL